MADSRRRSARLMKENSRKQEKPALTEPEDQEQERRVEVELPPNSPIPRSEANQQQDDGQDNTQKVAKLRRSRLKNALQMPTEHPLSQPETQGEQRENPSAQGLASELEASTTRKRKRGERGPSKGLKKSCPEDRPKLCVIGNREFEAIPDCTKIPTTLRLITCRNMPGPFSSYNSFPKETRQKILEEFLEVYAWHPTQDIDQAIVVFENMAANLYSQEMVEQRQVLKEKYGDDREIWKQHPPHWCLNKDYWVQMCNLWKTEEWNKLSETCRSNQAKGGSAVHHVSGSRSLHRHKKKLIELKGKDEVQLIDVIEKMHTRNTPCGKVPVNKKIAEFMNYFKELKQQDHVEDKCDVDLWTELVGGSKCGRIFGLGNRSVIFETGNQSPVTRSTPTKSTATPGSSRVYTAEEVETLLANQAKKYESAMELEAKRSAAAVSKQEFMIRHLYEQMNINMPDYHEEEPTTSNSGGNEDT